MHPDRKIGIAMGILLVGVVAALFFRNEPLPVDQSLSAEREQQLNEQLRERDVALYLENDRATKHDEGDPEWTLADVLNGNSNTQEALPIRMADAEDTADADSPIRTLTELPSSVQEFAPPVREPVGVAGKGHDGQSSHEPSTTTLPEIVVEQAKPARDEQGYEEYRIKYGDTLSGLSDRFLGSHKRYSEIYDANKDRIDNPDRLRVGTAIRIPKVIR